MASAPEVLQLLDQQLEDYQALHALAVEQRACLEGEDLSQLQQVFARAHRLMERIGSRQGRLGGMDRTEGAVQERLARLRQAIEEVEAARQAGEGTARRMLARTRDELHRLGRGQRAARGYQAAPVARARLYDGVR
ncbi:MAG: hypothetical protein AB1505_01065 [Candidatus Latescibacterota bacterium]